MDNSRVDDMFSDTCKVKLVEVVYEVYGKLIQLKHGDVQLDVANTSAEEADEGSENIKDCMKKKLVAKLEEKALDQLHIFTSNMNKVINNYYRKNSRNI
ncbi:translationally-controlled tumor protein homolog [Diabrotica virgifera virgifera]|uniref:Translationally-controlled tumor protein homolog n=1 Tax=Diabrotica virgifera virgifera TaxID=50390 RepID=A0A6P7FHZ2_DIAVI|nr:translationally-controlled tumor protein homolog [Diabrotica virgifera virgifera]